MAENVTKREKIAQMSSEVVDSNPYRYVYLFRVKIILFTKQLVF